eukprot:1481649-Amphidinium_carterae.1
MSVFWCLKKSAMTHHLARDTVSRQGWRREASGYFRGSRGFFADCARYGSTFMKVLAKQTTMPRCHSLCLFGVFSSRLSLRHDKALALAEHEHSKREVQIVHVMTHHVTWCVAVGTR